MGAFVSAASGLVRAGSHRYVIGDDLHHLAMFGPGARRPGELVRLFAGTIEAGKKARKKKKRDVESVAVLPAFSGYPHGALLALGSGSRRRRRYGALIAVDASGRATGAATRVDLRELYAPLAHEFGELNIEGAFVSGGDFVLLQRASTERTRNTRVRVKLDSVLDSLQRKRPPPSSALIDLTDYLLPAIDGIPLGFTDGAALASGGFAFTAVAERTGDAYADGTVAGSAIGIVGRDDSLQALWSLSPCLKVEGIAVSETPGRSTIEVVTDDDDPKVPSRLLAVKLALSRYKG